MSSSFSITSFSPIIFAAAMVRVTSYVVCAWLFFSSNPFRVSCNSPTNLEAPCFTFNKISL